MQNSRADAEQMQSFATVKQADASNQKKTAGVQSPGEHQKSNGKELT